MVDPAALAPAAVSLLVPFLSQVGNRMGARAGDELGDVLLDKLGRLYRMIKARLAGDPYSQAILNGIEDDPTSSARQRALEAVVEDASSTDQQFAIQLEALIAEIDDAGGVSIRVSDSGAVAGRDLRQRGHYVAGRDLHLDRPADEPPR